MSPDDLSDRSLEVLAMAAAVSPKLARELVLFGHPAPTEDDLLGSMLFFLRLVQSDPDEAEIYAPQMTMPEFRGLCRRLKNHIEKTLDLPVALRDHMA